MTEHTHGGVWEDRSREPNLVKELERFFLEVIEIAKKLPKKMKTGDPRFHIKRGSHIYDFYAKYFFF